MQPKTNLVRPTTNASEVADLFQRVRAWTMRIVEPLEIEDYVIAADFLLLSSQGSSVQQPWALRRKPRWGCGPRPKRVGGKRCFINLIA